jgi:hypothetical protein
MGTESDFLKALGLGAAAGKTTEQQLLEAVRDNAKLLVRMEKLKAKARTQIDRAWNKAIEEAAQVRLDGGSPGDIRKLKRRVR